MARRVTKAKFVGRQMRAGRSAAQAEGTWKMMQAQKRAMRDYYALNPRGNIIVEAEIDRLGSLILTPVSERVRAQMRRHNQEWTGHPDDNVYVQRDYDIEEFSERHLSSSQRRDLDQGWPVRIKMDPWEFGHYVGHDFHEVINP